jgi:hypothetical protein
MISSIFAQTLEARRTEFNAKFRLAQQRFTRLDADAFNRFLTDAVDGLVAAVDAQNKQAVERVTSIAYDCALQLAGHGLTGDSPRAQAMLRGWREVLIPAATQVAMAPEKVLPAICNALHQLATNESCDAALWRQRMSGIAPLCPTADDFLHAGQTLAWIMGLAHFREPALHLLESMNSALAAALLDVSEAELKSRIGRIAADRWFDPRSDLSRPTIRRIGAFRGFGGAFMELPQIRSTADGWVVQSGTDFWYLIADAFGATFHRASEDEWKASSTRSAAEHVGMRVHFRSSTLELTDAGPITSSASSGSAVACTFAHSYQIALISQAAT